MTGGTRLVHAMGTVVSLDARGESTDSRRTAAMDAAEAVVHAADDTFSTWKDASWVSRLRRGEVTPDACPADVVEVLRLCDRAEQLTGGRFSVCWRRDGTLDPTGLVKGWAAGRASDALRAAGVGDHVVNAAGDLAVAGRPEPGREWRVGIADPRARGRLLGALDCSRVTAGASGVRAVATSGPAERGEHVFDPRTGATATDVLSATVTGPDPALADAFATALVAAGAEAPGLLDELRDGEWDGLLLLGDRLVDPSRLLGG